jgi:tagatose 1,6-diphosphate aldolase GatY/KbaY
MPLVSTTAILADAEASGYAVGGFNCYNLEWAVAIIGAAEQMRSPVLLQILPGAIEMSGSPLLALCLESARRASVPVNVHLDHHRSGAAIRAGLEQGVTSVMADGAHLPFAENLDFTRRIAELVHSHGGAVEAELGLLSGTEDGYTVEAHEASLTDPEQAVLFAAETGVDALAVCVGNIHGPYPAEPQLDFPRLAAIHQRVRVPLVMHGASGLPEAMITEAIRLGIRKFNVNTELRAAYMRELKAQFAAQDTLPTNMLALMQAAVDSMQTVIAEKMVLFGSARRA